MTARNVALAVAAVLVVGQFLSSQTIVPLPPVGTLAVAGVTVLGTFCLLHLPSINDYVIGQAKQPDPAPPAAPQA